jgi:L-2,4-diaminobutyric acid acetyltransferase
MSIYFNTQQGDFLSTSQEIELRVPTLEDGMSVFRLIKRCPPLDTNSSYCNILQTSHFASTSVAAERGGQVVGFISGYILPDRPDTLFIWQVAVDGEARGIGLASKMLINLLARSACKKVSYLETTITQNNVPSWSLFKALGEKLSADLQSSIWLEKEAHFDGEHDSEALVRIGPFNIDQIRDLS